MGRGVLLPVKYVERQRPKKLSLSFYGPKVRPDTTNICKTNVLNGIADTKVWVSTFT